MLWTGFTISLPKVTILISGIGQENVFPSEQLWYQATERNLVFILVPVL